MNEIDKNKLISDLDKIDTSNITQLSEVLKN